MSSSSDFESDIFYSLKLLKSKFELSMIPFGRPNGLTLQPGNVLRNDPTLTGHLHVPLKPESAQYLLSFYYNNLIVARPQCW